MISKPELSASDIDSIVEKMPAFPQSVNKIIEMSDSESYSSKDMVEIIEHDPVMTMKLLKLANSAYVSLSCSVTSVQQAVIYLGSNTVKNLSISIATVGTLPCQTHSAFSNSDFLIHSLTTASIARQIAEKFGAEDDSSSVFIAGLLHDFGKVILANYAEPTFNDAIKLARQEGCSLHHAELRLFGFSHTTVTSMLAKKWRIPTLLIDAMISHHDMPCSHIMGDCVFAANQISKHLKMGFAGNDHVEPFPVCTLQRFGMGMNTMIETLDNLSEEVEKAKLFVSL
ncbi:MAG: HDOD domain-containing protein [Mariprofundaceae bacterium]